MIFNHEGEGNSAFLFEGVEMEGGGALFLDRDRRVQRRRRCVWGETEGLFFAQAVRPGKHPQRAKGVDRDVESFVEKDEGEVVGPYL